MEDASLVAALVDEAFSSLKRLAATMTQHFAELNNQAEATARKLYPYFPGEPPRFVSQLIQMDYSNQKVIMYRALALMMWSQIEHFLKVIAVWSGRVTKAKCRGLNPKEVLEELGLQCAELPCYGTANVLRLICNSIKHQGSLVTKEIAEAGWEAPEGTEIVLAEEDVHEFLSASKEFLIAVGSAAPTGDKDTLLDLLMSGRLHVRRW